MIPLSDEIRALWSAPNYVHLSTLRADGTPRNWVVWVGLEGVRVLVCTGDSTWKAKDTRRDPRVAMSVTDFANPCLMAGLQGRIIDVRRDEDCVFMDPISVKYTGRPFPYRSPYRVCFVIAIERGAPGALDFVHNPASVI
jgi:PPOX class probable F420-dependent enzyme